MTLDIELQQFKDFQAEIIDNLNVDEGMKIYRTEWRIFSDIHKIAGTVDALFENNKGEKYLLDWKRINKGMHSTPVTVLGKKLLCLHWKKFPI